jgi:hypothetical protein
MTESPGSNLLERLNRALGQVRAEYESDDDLYRRFAPPLYFNQLVGITPSFLVGGRGTGKTTTLRSMSFGGQARVHATDEPSEWDVVGAYWKVEPNVVSVFRGKGVDEDLWSRVFSHYLNLKLSSLVIDYAQWLEARANPVTLDAHRINLFTKSINVDTGSGLTGLIEAIDLALVNVEAKINGNITALQELELSVLGKPLDYLFGAITGLNVDRRRPFMFCLDEYENLSPYQQKLLNTLIKQVGNAPYTFKIGVRNSLAIDRGTLVDQQPLQDPADFTTVDIVSDLKGQSFEQFASTVVGQRLALVDPSYEDPRHLLPSLSIDEEAELLGSARIKAELLSELIESTGASSTEVKHAEAMTALHACMVSMWAKSHNESSLEVLRYAVDNPKQWTGRINNYAYAMLFAIRENRVGERKYYAGWKTYCQLADGNIRYMIRLVYEALRMHVMNGGALKTPVAVIEQTRAAARVGETTIRDLQGWSRQGAALTRLALGLGSIFGTLAREMALTTPEVDQFRVNYARGEMPAEQVDLLLGEAIGQGILLSFDGDKNARNSGATREMDYQLHPVLAPYFVYSARRKRRMTIHSDDILALTQRENAASTVRRILASRGAESDATSVQLSLLEHS